MGFDASWLSSAAMVDKTAFRLWKVIYPPEQQQNLIGRFVQRAVTLSNENQFSGDNREWFLGSVADAAAPLIVAFKDPAFREENEWRLVNPRIISGEHFNYRRSGHRIVPYVKIPISHDTAMRSLVRGPYFVNDRGSEDMLRYSGFQAGGNIRDSKLPLRR